MKYLILIVFSFSSWVFSHGSEVHIEDAKVEFNSWFDESLASKKIEDLEIKADETQTLEH